MGTRIAEGDIQINLNDEATLAGLRRVDTEFQRTMDKIDHQKATANADVDLSEVEDKLKRAQRLLKKYQGQRAVATLSADKKQLDKQIKAAQTSIKRLDGEKATVEIQVRGAEKAAAAQRAIKKAELDRIDAIAKAEAATAKVLDDAERRRMMGVNRMARVSSSLNKQREREMASAHSMALREERDRAKAIAQTEREIAQIPALKRQYAEAAVNLERLAKARRKASDEKIETVVDFKIAETEAKMVALHAQLERLGSPVTLEVNIRPGRNLGLQVRKAFEDRGTLHAASVFGGTVGAEMVRGFQRTFSPRHIGNVVQGGLQKVGDVLSNVSNAAVRLGPFTTSIRGLIGILGVLGPSILDIVGALGSMVSVAGAAALGAGALGVAFVGGAIPAVIGFMGVIKPMIQEFKNARKASDAYQNAVLKYGENSKQAKTAQKQLNQVLKGTDASTVKAIQSASKLGDRWKDLTAPARAAGFNVIGDAINFASKNMGWFARSTNEGFKAASTGVRDWIKGLNSAEGKGILSTMMSNFNGSIQPMMHGLGQIVTWLGRIGASASRFLPQAARGFDAWATKLADGVKDSSKLDASMRRLMDSAKSVGQLFMAAGRFLVSFFNPGVEAGQRLTDTMTTALNRWTAFNRTTQGKNNLSEFFQQSVTGAQALYSVFAPLLSSFVRWAALMAPAVSGFLGGAAAVSRFTAGVANLLQLQGGISTLAATLGALWAVGRISAATRAVMGFAAALGGVKKAQTAAAGASALSGVAGAAGGMMPMPGVAKARGEVTLLRRAAILAVPAIAGMGATAAAVSTAGLAVLAGAAVYGAYKLITLKSSSEKFRESVAKSLKPLNDYNAAVMNSGTAAVNVGTAQRDYAASVAHVAAYKAKLNRLEAEGKKATAEYKTTVDQLNQALAERQRADSNLMAARQAMTKSQNDQVKASNEMVGVEKNLTKAKQEQKKWSDLNNKSNTPESRQMLKDATKDLAVAQEAYNTKLQAQQAAAMQAATNAVNYQRAVRGLVPAAAGAATALAKLYQRSSKLATTIAVKYQDPKDAGAVASRANAALKAGVSQKIVTKIVADSSSAEQAIRKLTAQARALEAKRFMVKMGASDEASRTIAGIIAKVNSMPEGTAKIKARDQATSTIAKIISRVTGVPDKTARLMARDLLSGKAAAAKRAIGQIPPSKTVNLNAEASRALAQINLMKSGLDAIRSKSIVVSATTVFKESGSKGAGHAAGRGKAGREQAWVGEGSRWQGAKELIADHKTGVVKSVSKPTLMSLSPHQSVIPVEEPQHRKRGRELLADFARDMGFPSFASGRKKARTKPVNKQTQKFKKAPLSDYGQAQSRKKARGVAGKNTKFDPDTMPEIKAVATAKKTEDARGREVSIAESKLEEPDSFLIQTGTDANGDPIYDIDQGKVNSWAADLSNIGTLYQKVMDAIDAVVTAVNTAIKALDKVEQTASGNISRIGGKGGPMERDRAIANGKGVSKSRRQAAKERIGVYEEYLKTEHGVLSGAEAAEESMRDEKVDAGYRKQEAGVSRDQYNTDAAAVGGKAAADKASSNPKPIAPAAPQSALDIANTGVEAMQANDALAAIGQGVATSDADKVKAYQSVIDAAQVMLKDADPTNDSAAYSAIQSAAGSIGEIQNAGQQSAAAASSSAYQNAIGSSTARQDLFSNFGNNFGIAGASSAMRSSGFTGSGQLGQNPSVPGQGGTVNNVVVNNTFPTPPADPHTFSQGVAYELQAAL